MGRVQTVSSESCTKLPTFVFSTVIYALLIDTFLRPSIPTSWTVNNLSHKLIILREPEFFASAHFVHTAHVSSLPETYGRHGNEPQPP